VPVCNRAAACSLQPDHYDPSTRPAPPLHTRPILPFSGTLAAVWLRLEALKAAVKLKLSLNLRALKDVMGGGILVPGGIGTRCAAAGLL
jgi:hypothetical protein